MASVQDLFERCTKPETSTIVFGNLGRYPNLLQIFLRDFDGVLWIEPRFGETIHKPQGTSMIVLTSHLDLTWDDSIVIRAYHLGNAYPDWQRQSRSHDSPTRLYPNHYHLFHDPVIWRPRDGEHVVVRLDFDHNDYLRWLTFLDVWQYVPSVTFTPEWNASYLSDLQPRLQRSDAKLGETRLASCNVDSKTLLANRYFRMERGGGAVSIGDRCVGPRLRTNLDSPLDTRRSNEFCPIYLMASNHMPMYLEPLVCKCRTVLTVKEKDVQQEDEEEESSNDFKFEFKELQSLSEVQ